MTHELFIMTKEQMPFFFGERLYTVVCDDSKRINEACPVCRDNKKIEINGIEMDCPYCSCGSSKRVSIDLRHFIVTDAYVNEITIQGTSYKSDYKEQNNIYADFVRFWAFLSYRNKIGIRQESKQRVSSYSIIQTDILSDLTPQKCMEYYYEGVKFFKSKSDAKKFCDILNQYQKECLGKFNKEHHTNHNYPF